ncbi:MAG: DUF4276 family protein [Acidobacteriaceae bacterium]
MTRVIVVVEGQTEESFVKNVVAPILWPCAVFLIPMILGRPGHKGGNTKYARFKRDVILQLKQDATVYCSSMLDLYGLGRDFPGLPLPAGLPSLEKANHIERAMRKDICSHVAELRPDLRFIPYIQLHEYEGLLFSNPGAFSRGIGQPQLAKSLTSIRNSFATPEDINDDPNTAPSKRVLEVYPSYRKVLDGTQAAQIVGVEVMRQECPHFREWVECLAALEAF